MLDANVDGRYESASEVLTDLRANVEEQGLISSQAEFGAYLKELFKAERCLYCYGECVG
jgi:hypothetical protein